MTNYLLDIDLREFDPVLDVLKVELYTAEYAYCAGEIDILADGLLEAVEASDMTVMDMLDLVAVDLECVPVDATVVVYDADQFQTAWAEIMESHPLIKDYL